MSTATPTLCVFCDRVAVDRHHITGRGPDGAYLDDEHIADLCHDHHEVIHNILRSQGIDTPPPDAEQTALNAYAMHRDAVFVGQYGTRIADPILVRIAANLEATAHQLRYGTGGTK